jgi:hypothetical protein
MYSPQTHLHEQPLCAIVETQAFGSSFSLLKARTLLAEAQINHE